MDYVQKKMCMINEHKRAISEKKNPKITPHTPPPPPPPPKCIADGKFSPTSLD